MYEEILQSSKDELKQKVINEIKSRRYDMFKKEHPNKKEKRGEEKIRGLNLMQV